MQILEQPPPAPVPMEMDDVATLQLGRMRRQPKAIHLDELIPVAPKVLVDFTTAGQAYYDIMHLNFPFLTEWPESVELPEVTTEALLALGTYEPTTPAKAVHFYVDGSKVAGHGVGAATICLIESATGLALAGILPAHVGFAEHAYLGEHAAMVHAVLWAIHISTWHISAFPMHNISFHFNFDARTLDIKLRDGGVPMSIASGKPSSAA